MPVIPWWLGSIIANAAIALIEYLNHSHAMPSFWMQLLYRTGPLILVAQWGLYISFSGAPGWLMAWAVFSLGNVFTRMFAVTLLERHQIGDWTTTLVGVAAMTVGSLLVKSGMAGQPQ